MVDPKDKRIGELERQLAESKEDSARLDCADRQRWSIFFNNRIEMWVVQRNDDAVHVIGKGRTLREAIDAARKEAK